MLNGKGGHTGLPMFAGVQNFGPLRTYLTKFINGLINRLLPGQTRRFASAKIIFFAFVLLLTADRVIADSPSNETITLHDLIQEALEENPHIKAARASWNASEAVPKQVSTWPDPMLMFGINNVGPKYSVGTQEMSMLDFGFAQKIPFPGKLSLLGKMAVRSAEAMGEEFKATELNVIQKLKAAYFDYYYLKKSIDIINQTMSLLKKMERTAEIQYQVGKGIQQDVWRAKLEVSKLYERLQIFSQMEGTTAGIINSILNRPTEEPVGMPIQPEITSFTYTVNDFIKMAEENSPELKKMERIIEREKSGLTYAKLQYLPDFSINLGWGERGAMENMWVAGIGVEIPLYFWRKQAYGVQESRANLYFSENIYQNTKQLLYSDIKSAYLNATTSRNLIDLYKTAIIPQASGAVDSSMAGYSVGKVDFLTMVTNAITLLDYQIGYYEKLTEFEKAVAELEALTGVQFAAEGME
ncbi:MAG TPA: TolC family protein [bacterium]